jgi:hypothetical protein
MLKNYINRKANKWAKWIGDLGSLGIGGEARSWVLS